MSSEEPGIQDALHDAGFVHSCDMTDDGSVVDKGANQKQRGTEQSKAANHDAITRRGCAGRMGPGARAVCGWCNLCVERTGGEREL